MPTRTKNQPFTPSASRRSAVYAGVGTAAALLSGAALTGCSAGREEGGAAARESELRSRAAGDTAALLSAYDATIGAHPGLAGRLRPLRADLARQLDAFGGAPRAGGSTAPAPVPAREDAARRALADAEQRSADARTADLLDAPPELARLLASVAASRAGHALLLRS
ncbi:lipoprotein [Streptomyces capparidis]